MILRAASSTVVAAQLKASGLAVVCFVPVLGCRAMRVLRRHDDTVVTSAAHSRNVAESRLARKLVPHSCCHFPAGTCSSPVHLLTPCWRHQSSTDAATETQQVSCPGSLLSVLQQAACISLLDPPAEPHIANSRCPRTLPVQGRHTTADKQHRGGRPLLTAVWHLLFHFLLTTLHAGTTKLQFALGGFPCSLLATVRSVCLYSSICCV